MPVPLPSTRYPLLAVVVHHEPRPARYPPRSSQLRPTRGSPRPPRLRRTPSSAARTRARLHPARVVSSRHVAARSATNPNAASDAPGLQKHPPRTRDARGARARFDLLVGDHVAARVEHVERHRAAAVVPVARTVHADERRSVAMASVRAAPRPARSASAPTWRRTFDIPISSRKSSPSITAPKARKFTVPSSNPSAPSRSRCEPVCTETYSTVPPENHGRRSRASASRRAISAPTPVG